MKKFFRFWSLGLFLLPFSLSAAQDPARVILFPRLAAGQSIVYEIGYRALTKTTAESPVAAPMAPPGGQTDARLFLQVEVEKISTEAGKPLAQLRTQLLDPDSLAAASGSQPSTAQSAELPGENGKPPKIVEFTLHSNGQVTDLTGFDVLSPDEKAAWQEWVARFGVGAALPEKGVKPGEKWKIDEPITNALLTGLSWEKDSQYVDDEPCPSTKATEQTKSSPASPSSESCAVILTTATLKQKSPQKDATPDDYMLHDLRTSGIARGKNEIITYISRATGLVVRATEDANQSLNVMVAKSDGSNRVFYIIDAQSHAQVLLLPNP